MTNPRTLPSLASSVSGCPRSFQIVRRNPAGNESPPWSRSSSSSSSAWNWIYIKGMECIAQFTQRFHQRQDSGGGGGIEITETPSLSGLPPSARVDGLTTGILTHETNFGNTFFGRRRGGFEWWRLHWNGRTRCSSTDVQVGSESVGRAVKGGNDGVADDGCDPGWRAPPPPPNDPNCPGGVTQFRNSGVRLSGQESKNKRTRKSKTETTRWRAWH